MGWFLSDNDVGSVAMHLRKSGYYDPPLTTFLIKNVRPGSIALDIGANVGYFTALLASLVGPSGKVVACEPEPSNRQLLRMNCSIFDNVIVVPKAISDFVGTATLYLDQKEHGVHSLNQRNVLHPGESIEVGVETISSLEEELGVRFDVLKSDAQGEEVKILRGSGDLLSRRPLVMSVESWDEGLKNGDADTNDLVSKLFDNGLTPIIYEKMVCAVA